MLGKGVPRVDKVPEKEHKVHEEPELDSLAVAGVLCVFSGPEAELEANYDLVGDVVGSGVGGAGCRGDNGLNNSQEDGLL